MKVGDSDNVVLYLLVPCTAERSTHHNDSSKDVEQFTATQEGAISM